MILHLLRMRRNVNRNVYNAGKCKRYNVTAVHSEMRCLHFSKDLQFIMLCVSFVDNMYKCRLNNANAQSCLFTMSRIYWWYKHSPCSKVNNSKIKIINPNLNSSSCMEHTSSTNFPHRARMLARGCVCVSPQYSPCLLVLSSLYYTGCSLGVRASSSF